MHETVAKKVRRERLFVKSVRALAATHDVLPSDRPAASMVHDGDLAADLNEPDAAASLFNKTGICVFDEGLPASLIESCRTAFEQTSLTVDAALAEHGIGDGCGSYKGFEIAFTEVCQRGRERLDVRMIGMEEGAMADERLHGRNAVWMPFIRAVLGQGAHECFRGVVDNRPGSGRQEWHADGVHASYRDGATEALRPEEWHGVGTGAAAMEEEAAQRLTLFLPLVNVADEACGATQFFPGSHTHATANLYRRLHPDDHVDQPPFCTPRPPVGGMICFDYRLIHRGCPNRRASGGATRPILYIVYAREGCHDRQNFPADKPLFRVPRYAGPV